MATVFGLGAYAQGYYYKKTFGTTSEYNPRNSGAGTTVVISADATAKTKTLSAVQSFPFTWNFYGTPVTSYKVSSSGYLTFNTSMTADSNNNVALPSPAAPAASIFAFWDNLKIVFASGVNTAFPQGVRSWTYGTAPNRVHVVQWQLAQKDDGTSLTNISQFAIRFYEADGGTKFDIVHNFGAGTLDATVGVQDLMGNATQATGSPTLNWGGAEGGINPEEERVYTFIYGTQIAYDVKMLDVESTKFLKAGQSTNVGYSFVNNGSQTITSFRVNYTVNGGPAATENVTGVSIAGGNEGQTYAFSHATPLSTSVTGVKNIKVWVDNINGSNVDMDHSNDTMTTVTTFVDNTVKRKSLHEVFTASTCPPCLPGNQVLQSVLQERMGGYTVIKYQYSFPGTGDPYFTLECQTRGSYYGGINSVPRLQVDGKWNDNPNGYDVGTFDQFYEQPSVMTITANQTIVDNTITINAKVKPVAALPGNYKIHFAVLEKVTTRNVKTNGETEFHWVMKKMLPDANGSAITFASDAEQAVTKSYTFPGGYRLPPSAVNGTTGAYAGINLATENSVEEMSDLIGVVFVQDEGDKEVMQSEWSGNNPWDYWAGTVETSIGATGVTMYPNPAQTTLTFNASDIDGVASIKVFDITGKEVLTLNAKGGIETAVDCGNLSNGIYMVQITANGTTATQKVVISK